MDTETPKTITILDVETGETVVREMTPDELEHFTEMQKFRGIEGIDYEAGT